MQIDGGTELIGHFGHPTFAFRAPLIYNPYFASIGVNAAVVPMGCRPEGLAAALRGFFALDNARGALVTMPHKVSVVALLDRVSAAAAIAGSCNAVRRDGDGRLVGDMFDGEGFVRGLARKGFAVAGARALVVGCGGVGSAIAASLAGKRADEIALFDVDSAAAASLAARLRRHHPSLPVKTGANDPAGFDLVVNATPLGMQPGDPLPVDVGRLGASTFVGEVVMRTEVTEFVAAARRRGCRVQVGTDMLYEMIPPYLEFFGLPTTSPDALRAVSLVQP